MVDLSIILVNYNTINYTLPCIESIYKHSKGFSFEIILIDNASEVFCPEDILRSFPEVKIIANIKNLGFSKANNQGIKVSKGEYILLLNNDTELVSNSIKICRDLLRSNKQLGAVSPRLIYPNGTPQHCVNAFPSIRNELWELLRFTKLMSGRQLSKKYKGRHYNYNESGEVPWVWATFFLFPKSVLSSFPESKLPDEYFMYYEDVHWCYRFRQAGYGVYYFSDTHVVHHLSQSSATIASTKHDMIMENEWQFMITNRGSLYAFLYFLTKGLVLVSQRHGHLRQLGFKYLKIAIC